MPSSCVTPASTASWQLVEGSQHTINEGSGTRQPPMDSAPEMGSKRMRKNDQGSEAGGSTVESFALEPSIGEEGAE